MKKILSVVLALVMVFSLTCVAFAAEGTFVPSITYKDAPELISAELIEDGKKLEDIPSHCLLITPVAQAEKQPLLPVAAKTLLLDVYQKLNSGAMELPADKLKAAGLIPNEAIIRDLVDISWICEEVSPTHVEKMVKDGVQLRVTFKMNGLEAGEAIAVMTYKNNAWDNIANVKNNGDGTVTCTFDHLCPVAFAVGPDGVPDTGVEFDMKLVLWVCALVASSAALVVVVSKRRQNA